MKAITIAERFPPLAKHIKLHIDDAIRHLRIEPPDTEQAEFNIFEIAGHLGIAVDEVWDVTFSHIVQVKATNAKEAAAKALKSWSEEAPRPDEMNIDVEISDKWLTK